MILACFAGSKASRHCAQLAVLFASLHLLCCKSQSDISGPGLPASVRQGMVSDQNHSNGTTGFVFLPPVVATPADYGGFQPGLPVTVRIDELNLDGVTLRTLATFTAGSGPGREHMHTHYLAEPYYPDYLSDGDRLGYYYARWLTDNAHLTPTARYRIRVLVPAKGSHTRELGFSDVVVANTWSEYFRVDSGQHTSLLNGATLVIKFRVDWRAVDRDHDGIFDWVDNCPAVPNPGQRDTLQDGIGDACRCFNVKCPAPDACHIKGACQPETGTCSYPNARDGTGCLLSHAVAACYQGRCQKLSCHAWFDDCDGANSDGCETAITTRENCGYCGNTCPDGPNSRALCRGGHCELVCPTDYADCDGVPSNGCEQNIASDPNNCGACAQVCTAHESCMNGSCTSQVCEQGFGDCNHDPTDGCEQDLASDVHHCGRCHEVCNLQHASPTCRAGGCAVLACDAGYADCNADPADGCESDITSDQFNCGACSNICALPNAAAACSQGVCKLIACNFGFADCDGYLADGCEVTSESDANNCDDCGSVCNLPHAMAVCQMGKCGIGRCDDTFSDCNGVASDGCEVNLQMDEMNCGACTTACHVRPNAVPLCNAGVCGVACDSGWSDCDSVEENGCETSTRANCEVCSCSIPNAEGECTDGACGFSVCKPGYADCDGDPDNGCEVDLAKNCGECLPICSDGDPCTEDRCDANLGCVHDRGAMDTRCFDMSSYLYGCTKYRCHALDAVSYECVTEPVADGTRCPPEYTYPIGGDLCAIPGTCQAGACVGAGRRVCVGPNDPCHYGSCGPETGCHVWSNNEGFPCGAPASACREADKCHYGTCIPGAAKPCTGDDAGVNIGGRQDR